MAFKFNPLTGKFDLVNDSSSSAADTSFDPTPTPEMASINVQDAIEEADMGFSFNRVRTGKRVTIRADRTMVTFGSLQMDNNSSLVIYGRLGIV
jgi:hypothetical protein